MFLSFFLKSEQINITWWNEWTEMHKHATNMQQSTWSCKCVIYILSTVIYKLYKSFHFSWCSHVWFEDINHCFSWILRWGGNIYPSENITASMNSNKIKPLSHFSLEYIAVWKARAFQNKSWTTTHSSSSFRSNNGFSKSMENREIRSTLHEIFHSPLFNSWYLNTLNSPQILFSIIKAIFVYRIDMNCWIWYIHSVTGIS